MSIYAALDTDTEGGDQVGTTTGWGDFSRWVDGLDVEPYGQVVHLVEYGWCQRLRDLESQLSAGLKDEPPGDPDTVSVADALLAVIRGRGDAEVLTLTDGLGPEK